MLLCIVNDKYEITLYEKNDKVKNKFHVRLQTRTKDFLKNVIRNKTTVSRLEVFIWGLSEIFYVFVRGQNLQFGRIILRQVTSVHRLLIKNITIQKYHIVKGPRRCN